MAISGRHPRSVLAAVKTVLAPRLVIARRPEADVAISGRHCRSERAIEKRHAPPICHCEERSDVAISGRHPRSVLAAVKTVLAPRLVIARSEATWQSRSTRSDNRKASANSTPRKAVKI